MEINLGNFALAELGVAAGHGRIKQQTFFTITNLIGFSRFTEYLITQSEFTWRLKSDNVQAKAFGFIPANGLTFVKVSYFIFTTSTQSLSDLIGFDTQGNVQYD